MAASVDFSTNGITIIGTDVSNETFWGLSGGNFNLIQEKGDYDNSNIYYVASRENIDNFVVSFETSDITLNLSGESIEISWNNLITSNIVDMSTMFSGASNFNQYIGSWDTQNVTNMSFMFYEATNFNQNLSLWCVPNIGSKPDNFDTGSAFENLTNLQPIWGTCPGPTEPSKPKHCCPKLVYYSPIQDSYKLGAGNSRKMKMYVTITNSIRYRGGSIC